MAPKPSNARSNQGTNAGGKFKGASGGADSRKGGKGGGGGGGSGAVEGGAMATAIIQKKAVGAVSSGVEAQVRVLLKELRRLELLHLHQQEQQQQRRHLNPAQKAGTASVSIGPLSDAPSRERPGTGEGEGQVDNRTLAAFSALWDQLLAAGFGAEQVKRVVPELPRPPSLDAALDWLCLNLPAAELPYKFKAAGGGGAGGGAPVRILAVAQQQQQQQPLTEACELVSGSEAAAGVVGLSDRMWEEGSEVEDAGPQRVTEEPRKKYDAAEEDAAVETEAVPRAGGGGGAAMKEWILRYMDQQSGSGSSDGEAEEEKVVRAPSPSPRPAPPDLEWQLWSDPREVARRKLERGRSRLKPEEQRRHLAAEWGKSKEVAAKAKATGDKARQKAVGLMIRDLKLEMVAMGVSEQQLDQVLEGSSAAADSAGVVALVPGGVTSGKEPKGGKDKDKDKAKDKAKDKDKAVKKDKAKESEKGKDKGGKGKEADGRQRGGGKSKEKGKEKGKGQSRRTASPPPPSSSSSASDWESGSNAPTAATAIAGCHFIAPEPDDDVVPDSWEERNPEAEELPTNTAIGTAADGDGVGFVGSAEMGHGLRLGAANGVVYGRAMDVGTPTKADDGAELTAVMRVGGGDSNSLRTHGAEEAAATDGEELLGGGGGDGGSDSEGVSPGLAVVSNPNGPPIEGSIPGKSSSLSKVADANDSFSLPRLFDDDGSEGGAAGGLNASAPTALPSALLRGPAASEAPGISCSVSSGGGKAASGKGGKRGAKVVTTITEVPKTPRAHLAQICQKHGWLQPRFERLAVAQEGVEVGGAAFRYNVVLDLGPARGLAKRRNLYGIRVYGVPVKEQHGDSNAGNSTGLPPLPPTWPDPTTAQDAAATRALYELTPVLQLQQYIYQSLSLSWRQLWLEWEAVDGAAAAAAAAEAAGAAAMAADTAAAAAKRAEDEKLAALRELLLSKPPLLPGDPTSILPRVLPTPPDPTSLPRYERDAPPYEAPPAEIVSVVQSVVEEKMPPVPPPPLPQQQLLGTELQNEEGDEEEMDEAVADSGGGMEGAGHDETMTHHGGDSVEQEEWEDLMALGEQQQQGEEDEEEGTGGAEAAAAAAAEADAAAREAAQRRRELDAEAAVSNSLRMSLERWTHSPAGQAMAATRGSLPIAAVRGELLEALRQGDVVVVSGDTGCGKTTQVPQFLLEDAIQSGVGGRTHIVITQPRRIAAISVAERVAEERGEPPPGSPGPSSTTGYHVRLGAAVTRHTRLTFCTTGILLRRLAGDASLRGVSHVVVDEVHERSLQSDFLMALLRELLAARRAQRLEAGQVVEGAPAAAAPPPALKVVLMSATLDARLFAAYYGGCQVLHAAGRTFPVTRLFLEDVYDITEYRLASDAPVAIRRRGPSTAHDYAQRLAGGSRGQRDLVSRGFGDDESLAAPLNPDYNPDLYVDRPLHVRRNLARLDEHRIDYDLLETLLSYIDTTSAPGAVLVFLPGIGEINHLHDRLTAQRAYTGLRGGASSSSSASYGSARCMVLPLHSAIPPAGQRAALKPPPPGLRKIVLATNIAETSLTIEDVVAVVDTGKHKERRFNPARSMSMLVEDWVSAASAQQRAGRAGRVRPGVSYATYTQARFESGLRRYGAPEITRVPLEELVLQILLMGLGPVASFLSRVMEPPQPRAVIAALEVLRQVGAMELTATSTSTPAAGAPTEQAPVPGGAVGGASASTEGGSGGVLVPSAAVIIHPPTHREVLSALGRQLALLPVSPRLGKLLVLGALLGCLGPAVTIAASMSHKSPFLTPTDDRGEAERARRALAAPGAEGIAAGQQSDHLLLVTAYDMWRVAASPKFGGGPRAAAALARRHFLHAQTLEQLAEMRCQLAAMLADARLVTPGGSERSGGGYGDGEGGGHGGGKAAMAAAAAWLDDPMAPWNKFARDPLVVKAVLCAALNPSVAVMADDSCPTSPPRWTDAAPVAGNGEEVFLHPSSVVAPLCTPQIAHPYLVYLEKVKTARLYLRDVTAVSPLSLMLFGGSLTVLHAEGAVLVGAAGGSGSGGGGGTGAGLRISCRAQTAVLVKQLRGALNRLLERRFTGTGGGGGGSGNGVQVAEAMVGMIRQMLREEDEQRSLATRLM